MRTEVVTRLRRPTGSITQTYSELTTALDHGLHKALVPVLPDLTIEALIDRWVDVDYATFHYHVGIVGSYVRPRSVSGDLFDRFLDFYLDEDLIGKAMHDQLSTAWKLLLKLAHKCDELASPVVFKWSVDEEILFMRGDATGTRYLIVDDDSDVAFGRVGVVRGDYSMVGLDEVGSEIDLIALFIGE